MEGRRSFSLGAREIADFLGKNPAAVTGYFRRERGLRDKTERLILFLEGGRKNLNN
jgi:predicted transcriptional regulator